MNVSSATSGASGVFEVYKCISLIMISQEEKDTILNSYKWIKVPKFVDNDTLSWEDRYKKLDEHHIWETSFLIEKVRELTLLL